MKYRSFGQDGWPASVLGFGSSRLPIVGNDWFAVDEQRAVDMLRAAIDAGVNYIDTAWDYHGGNSERVIGLALKDGYRERVRVATKLPCWLVRRTEDFDSFLEEQLRRLQTDHVDYYLLHRLNIWERSWPGMRDLGVFAWAEKIMAQGRIGALGFSFHDSIDVLREILDAWDRWALCQIQYNYMDLDEQAGTAGLRLAAGRGLPVVIMEPLLGGKLADPPPAVRAIWDAATKRRSPVEWALQWLWNQPEVTVVLSGMSTMDQLTENISFADRSGGGVLDEASLTVVDEVRRAYQSIKAIGCTQCRYCMPCPHGVNIPYVFSLYNRGLVHEDIGFVRYAYHLLPEDSRANACASCLECEPKCSQHLPISQWMRSVHAVLGEGLNYPERQPAAGA